MVYLHCLLTTQHDNIAARIITMLTFIDTAEIANVQRCYLLEERLQVEKQEGMRIIEQVRDCH